MGTLTLLAGPARQRHPHDAPHKVEPPQRAIFLARRARAVAVVAHPFDLAPRLFLGRVVDDEHNRGFGGHPLRRAADDPRPQLPARLVERPAQKHIKAREVLDRRRPGEPQIGRDRLALPTGHRPAPRQHGEGLPRRCREQPGK